MRRTMAGLALLVLVGACQPLAQPVDNPPWKTGGAGVTITSAPDAGGTLSFRNCPTLDEAKAAVPTLVSGPDANAVPFKTMILQCSYSMDERDVQGRPAGIGILVFDASADGVSEWDSVRTDPQRVNLIDIPGLGERAFATGAQEQHELWVVQREYGLHLIHTRPAGIPLDQMVALARAMVTGLDRAPR